MCARAPLARRAAPRRARSPSRARALGRCRLSVLACLVVPIGCAGDVRANVAPLPLPAYARYVVVGAGPGGLQLAHYLESAGRDYVVLDAASGPASFFTRFPRWRQLISINKREVGRADSLSFAERHDWNSLLTDASHAAGGLASTTDARLDAASQAPALRFTSWSDAYFPHADTLVAYMGAWAAEPRASSSSSSSSGSSGGSSSNNSSGSSSGSGGSSAALAGLGRTRPLRVHYDTAVARVARPEGWTPRTTAGARFVVTTSSGATVSCAFLIVATGLQEPVPLPSRNGSAAVAAGLVHTYATAPAGDPRAFAGKRVLVIGHGNAAFEYAHHILGETAYVHVAGRTTSRVALALESHYPGNVRAVHASVLETYNLKSLDGITSAPFERLTFARAPGGGVNVAVADSVGCTHDAFGRATSRCSFRYPYDLVIACLGWRLSRAVFAADVFPALAANGKHPAATPRYESVNVSGMFFAGTLAHAADHKKSSGGFIHGFRYTARALHRMLEEDEADAAEGAASVDAHGAGAAACRPGADACGGAPPARWPSTRTGTLRSLVALLLRRLNNGAATYQMFGSIADVFVLDALAADGAAGFASSGVHAAMELPWEYFDETAAAAAAAGTDPSGLAADVAALQARPPAGAPPRTAAARASEAAVDAALAGSLHEEVPSGWVSTAARAWAATAAAAAAPPPPPAAAAPAEWLQVTLEFGPSPPPGRKDPFALDRADVSLAHPERSHFLHPVVRYFSGCGDANATCAPTAMLHVVEDFHAEWRIHTAHVLPLARFLQEVGARRCAAATTAAASSSGAPRAAALPWAPPALPPAFLAGVLMQLASGCDSATLYWGGGAFAVGGGADGWVLQLSIAAERALAGLRALAVHAVDATPSVRTSAAEDAWTQSVREKWAAFRAHEAAGGGGSTAHDAAELPRPPQPQLSAAQAAAAAAARADADVAYGALAGAHAPGLGVLVVDARAGMCRVLAENLGVELGAVRVFEPGAGEGTKGAAVNIERRPLTAAAAAPHIRAVFTRAAR